MTLIEALKTGKKIRKKSSGLYVNKDYPSVQFTIDDVLADDWEVEQTPVPVTREQFDSAWYKAKTSRSELGFPWDMDTVYKVLIKELGL